MYEISGRSRRSQDGLDAAIARSFLLHQPVVMMYQKQVCCGHVSSGHDLF